MVPSFSTIILYSFRFPWGCFLRGLALIKRKRWGLLRWQLLLHCRSCWCLWERGLGLDRVRLHSRAGRNEWLAISEDTFTTKKKHF